MLINNVQEMISLMMLKNVGVYGCQGGMYFVEKRGREGARDILHGDILISLLYLYVTTLALNPTITNDTSCTWLLLELCIALFVYLVAFIVQYSTLFHYLNINR